MQIRLDIKRQKDAASQSFVQSIVYEFDDKNEVLSNALTNINKGGYKDINAKAVDYISWECSCLQKKCGACAMVIDGRPRLACDAKLCEFDKKGYVLIEPLKKFTLVKDLTVDRTAMFENLKAIDLALKNDAYDNTLTRDISYESSGCLQCGCCLEVCPNFYVGGSFFGMASALPMSKILSQSQRQNEGGVSADFYTHFYSGCGKSLACRNICPAGLDIDKIMSRSNAAAVWRRNSFKKK